MQILQRAAILLLTGLVLWDVTAFVQHHPTFPTLLAAFLWSGTLAAASFALGGAAIAWVWPRERAPQLLGWALSLAAFAWIDATVAPLVPELPRQALLEPLGVAGVILTTVDRAALPFLFVALARFAVLFPGRLCVAELESMYAAEWQGRSPAPAEGTRLLARIERGAERLAAFGRARVPLPGIFTRPLLRDRPPGWLRLLWRAPVAFPGWLWAAAPVPAVLFAVSVALGWESGRPSPLGLAALVLEITLAGYLVFTYGFVTRAQYTRAGGAERERLLWLLEGIALSVVLLVLVEGTVLLTPNLAEPALEVLLQQRNLARATVLLSFMVSPAAFVLIASIAAAAFYRGDIDPRLAIRRTTVYGGLGAVFLFLFAGVGNAAQDAFESALGMPPVAGSVLVGGGLAVAMVPLKRRLDRYVTRLLPPHALAEEPTETLAILFADLVGFTTLTGADQRTGLTVMSVFHKAAERVAREQRGRFVKAVADEVLLVFEECESALTAAAALPAEFRDAAQQLGLPAPQLRTGIHYGAVTRSPDGDVFGDGVNIAARIHGLAAAGQVLLSAAVRERLTGAGPALVPLGARTLRNVAIPVECYALAGAGPQPAAAAAMAASRGGEGPP